MITLAEAKAQGGFMLLFYRENVRTSCLRGRHVTLQGSQFARGVPPAGSHLAPEGGRPGADRSQICHSAGLAVEPE